MPIGRWMRDKAVVARWTWNVRVVMYLGFSAPGFLLLATSSPLMPPLICSIVFAVCGLLNLVSLSAVLPTEKEWAWLWFTADKKKTEDEGGKYESFVETVCMFPKRFICGAFEKNTLGLSHALASGYIVHPFACALIRSFLRSLLQAALSS